MERRCRMNWNQLRYVLTIAEEKSITRAAQRLYLMPDAAWQVLANTAKHWLFEDLTPCGWKQAQTTGGGLSLTELEPSFQFRGCPQRAEPRDRAGNSARVRLPGRYGRKRCSGGGKGLHGSAGQL